MRFLDIQQNTPEWEELRRSKIGASDCSTIMGCNPYKTPSALWDEKVLGKDPFVTSSMERGTRLEPFARAWVEEKHKTKYNPVCVQSDDYDFMMASLDGYDPIYEMFIEIKCPNDKTYKVMADGDIPIYYHWQLQHQMAVTGLKKAILVAYNGLEGIEIAVDRDERMIKDLIAKERDFYASMLSYRSPEPEIEERNDEDVLDAINAWKKAKEAREEAQELEKICRDSLIYLANDKPYRCLGVTVKKHFQKGEVDYKKIPELNGVNTESYRKAGIEYWKVYSSSLT